MKILERTFEERLAHWMEDPEFQKAYEGLGMTCAISLKTTLFVPANKTHDIFNALLYNEVLFEKLEDAVSFLCQTCQTEILVKGTEADIL